MAGTLYQYYNTGDDYNEPTYYYDGLRTYTSLFMTFKTTVAHKLSSVKLKLWREGSRTGSVYVYLYSAHSSTSVPVSKLATANTMPFNDISTDSSGTWYEFTFSTPYQLLAYTQYNIVIYNGALDSSSNKINWRSDSTNPTYANGTGGWGHSSNTEFYKVSRDFMFEEYGVTTNTSTVSMSALLKGIDTKTVSIDTLLRDTDSKTVAVDTLIRDTDSKTVSVDTLIKATDSTTVDVDTLLRATDSTSVDLDTLIKAIDIQQISVDTLIQGTDSTTVSIDTLIGKLQSTAVLTVDHTKFTTDRYNVPITIDQSWTAIKEFLNCDYKKIKIYDENEDPCWIEKVTWDAVNELVEITFKAPYLSSSVDTKFYILGHPGDEDNPYIGEYGTDAAKEVWS